MRPLDLVAQPSAYGGQEVGGVLRALEADDVGAEQPAQYLVAPRQLRVEPVCGERNVMEIPDRDIRAQFAHHLRHELQLVVVNPDRALRRRGIGGRLGEPSIHGDIGIPPLAVVLRRSDHVVIERPDRVVREALVVLRYLLSAQRDRNQIDAVGLERLQLDVGLTGPAHPGSVDTAHHRFEGGDESAGRRAPGLLTIGPHHTIHGQAVGDDDEICCGHEGSSRGFPPGYRGTRISADRRSGLDESLPAAHAAQEPVGHARREGDERRDHRQE